MEWEGKKQWVRCGILVTWENNLHTAGARDAEVGVHTAPALSHPQAPSSLDLFVTY